MPTIKERVAEWTEQRTQLQTEIAALTEKLAAVEGREDQSAKVSELTTALETLRSELEALKAAKPAPKSEEPPPPPPPPKSEEPPKNRKASLADRLRKRGEADPQAVARVREPRRKLNLI